LCVEIERIRKTFPSYNQIEIMFVYAEKEKILERAEKRGVC
jgi:hypothetical protein